jgi:SAM-dependent methyltransferase
VALKNLRDGVITPPQAEFYVLDIGAGNFGFAHFLADQINNDSDWKSDVKVHIFSLRGEPNKGEEVEIHGATVLYKLGGFKIENLEEIFANRGYSAEVGRKFDLIVSANTFYHLMDPYGTLYRFTHLLKPQTGLFLFDGFLLLVNQKVIDYVQLLSAIKLFNVEVIMKGDFSLTGCPMYALRIPEKVKPHCPL